MIIALTGLHGSGKSYFARNIPPKYGFDILYKNDIIKRMCKEKEIENWHDWYIKSFNNNKEKTTIEVLSHIPTDKNIILDAIHSYDEWMIAKEYIKDIYLAVLIAPEDIRKERRDEKDEEKDIKRISFWHSNDKCLLTESSWAFNGAATLEENERSFLEFLKYINSKKIKEKVLERKIKL